MKEYLTIVLELSILFPCMQLAYLPMKQYFKLKPLKLMALTLLFSFVLCFGGGAVSYFFRIATVYMFLPLCALLLVFYINTLKVTGWKSISVFLAVGGLYSCLRNIALAIGDFNYEKSLFLPANSSLIWLSLCILANILLWHPAIHAARQLLENNAFAHTWYVFWGLPLLFVILNIAMVPLNPQIMTYGRLKPMYLVICVVLVFLLLLFYALFYLMAAGLNRNDKLRRENQFLYMQQSRYDSLNNAISQIKEARHDMRHHFNVMQSFAAKEDWEELKKYLCEVQDSIMDFDLGLCENTAVDSIAGHYSSLFRKNNIPFKFELNLPQELIVPEIDISLVMSNLLENAYEASMKTEAEKRFVNVKSHLYSEYMILISVENAFEGEIRVKDGVFQSSKRRGEGVGLQSVRHIAEKNGGYSKFIYENGVFYANIILRKADESEANKSE